MQLRIIALHVHVTRTFQNSMPIPALERPPLDWQSEPASAGTKIPGCLLGSDRVPLYAKRCEIDHSGPPTYRQFGTRQERHIFQEWTEIQADRIEVDRADRADRTTRTHRKSDGRRTKKHHNSPIFSCEEKFSTISLSRRARIKVVNQLESQ